MACGSCSSSGNPRGCKNNGSCGVGGCGKLTVFNWLLNMELPGGQKQFPIVEVRFKNARKEFFRNSNELPLYDGDLVAVESQHGFDIGIISLSGELVRLQMQKKGIYHQSEDIPKVIRKATEKDIDVWQRARAKESATMTESRKITAELGLDMKICDVEYQGDGTKAIFYYTAEGRVDFRELIKRYADQFKVRIEMKQIGMRQEASRLGGIGSCGRELCCSTWLTDFRSVSTSAARYQQLSLNPTKLAGQCGKLKCCLNYELDAYMDEVKKFPNTELVLKTEKGNALFQKMDIFGNKMWYSYEDHPEHFVELSLERVNQIISLNKANKKPKELLEEIVYQAPEPKYSDVVGQDSLTRFDGNKGNRRKGGKNKKFRKNPNRSNQQNRER